MGCIYIEHRRPDQAEAIARQLVAPGVWIRTCNRPFRRFWFEDPGGFGRSSLASPVFE
jgi:hypothetical protein